MKPTIKALGILFLYVSLIVSCNKENTDPTAQGEVEFNVTQSQLKSLNIELADTIASNLAYIVLSIEDTNGKVTKNSEKVELYNMNGNYISKPLSLTIGNYKLTSFFVLDRNNNIVYAAPIKGSPKAYLVSEPLSISFGVEVDKVVKVVPEVISAIESTPEAFGYTTFGFNIAKTFDFLLGVFVYNDTVENFALTDANVLITSNNQEVFKGKLTAIYSQSGVTIQDSIGITNKISLPEKYNSYTLEISKFGYKPFEKTFSKEELRKYFSSQDYGPLVVVMEKSTLFDGLVAYYKLDSNALDYSGRGNNGVVYNGFFNQDTERSYFDVSPNNYIEINNSSSLNMEDAITLSAWVKGQYYIGGGNDPIITKPYTSHTYPYYQYQLGIVGDYGPINPFTFGVSMSINGVWYGVNSYPTQWQTGKWYFVVATYDGNALKLYVNGQLANSEAIIGKINNYGQNVWIGHGNNNGYFNGSVDEARIYNRALSQDEITVLYNE